MAAPSLHSSGRRYAWEASSDPGEVPVAEAPPSLQNPASRTASPDTDQIVQVGQNTALTSLAGTMRRRGIGEIGRVEWEPGPVTITADDALAAAAADPEARNARDAAADWLRSVSADAPMKKPELQAAAKGTGVAWSAVKRAQTTVGVKPKRQGFGPGGTCVWALPAGERPPAIEGQQTPPTA